MLKSPLQAPNQTPSRLLPFQPCGLRRSHPPLWPLSPSVWHRRAPTRRGSVHCRSSGVAEAVEVGNIVKGSIKIDVVITVKLSTSRFIDRLRPTTVLDDISDLLGMSILLELVSAELDQKSVSEKDTVEAYVYWAGKNGNEVNYKGSFMVPSDFGDVGGVYVTNKHPKEIFLEDIVLTADETTKSQTISCKSWVHSKSDDPSKRIFFTSKCYLPSQTPKGLLRLREKELEVLGGNGKGERKKYERIYDYDTYNDLGNPEKGLDKGRPVLGGNKELPYPRRCRTGRPRNKKDPLSETRRSNGYVPRDEEFSEVKQLTFTAKTVLSVLPALAPYLETTVMDADLGFPYFTAIDKLFDEVPLQQLKDEGFLRTIVRFVPRLFKAVSDITEQVLLFETPEMIDRDKFSWFRDEEFTRQTLAGLNPCSIQLVTEFPLLSKLDPNVYGPPESKITVEVIEQEIKGVMTANEALNQKRLFMLDYHDLLLPYVHKVRELEGTTLYGSRTLFFLMPDGTLRLIAIELTRPASPTAPQWKRVFTPCWNATGTWLWRLAKAHVCAHDSGYHQLVSHWLRTHCCTEPYIIATHRQLSAMHPIYRLLHPHFRYTMKINALAREQLVNGEGIIESSFSPGKYSMEISSVAYREQWRFDMEALPADLIRRGMAVKDPMAEHGLQLTIKDYPFANDGLLIWSNIEQWVTDYVSHYYPSPTNILEDYELQGWWTEIRTKGHADKKDEPWWPVLNTPGDLTHILTTIIWVASGHHAAVNFGQYHYAGYFPNRPTIIRKNMPVEDETSEGFKRFLVKPEEELLQCFPSQKQAVVVMAVIDVLSSHSPDEEYIGGEPEPAWGEEPVIQAAFERFNGRMVEIEGIIDGRNADPKLMNRCGAGIVPYQLLKPFSKPGVTGMGIPNSISI